MVEVSGQQVLEALENGVSEFPKLAGKFPQVAGLKFEWNSDLEPFQRINPCGYAGLQVTQLSALAQVDFRQVQERLVSSLVDQLGYSEVNEVTGHQEQALESRR